MSRRRLRVLRRRLQFLIKMRKRTVRIHQNALSRGVPVKDLLNSAQKHHKDLCEISEWLHSPMNKY